MRQYRLAAALGQRPEPPQQEQRRYHPQPLVPMPAQHKKNERVAAACRHASEGGSKIHPRGQSSAAPTAVRRWSIFGFVRSVFVCSVFVRSAGFHSRNKQYDAPNAAMMACTENAAASSAPASSNRLSFLGTSTAAIAAKTSAVANARGCRCWSVKLSPVPETGRVS